MATSGPAQEFTRLASAEQLAMTVRALEANGMRTTVVETGEEAHRAVLEMIPDGVEVYNASSRTLEAIGLANAIATSTRFQPVRRQLTELDRATQQRDIRTLTARPDVIVGSVQAITAHGHVVLASATGSQLGPAASGAGMVIWVVGTHKLVRTLEEGLCRIQEYCYPLENERAQRVYGAASAVNKLLIVQGEAAPDRIRVVFVKQVLGF